MTIRAPVINLNQIEDVVVRKNFEEIIRYAKEVIAASTATAASTASTTTEAAAATPASEATSDYLSYAFCRSAVSQTLAAASDTQLKFEIVDASSTDGALETPSTAWRFRAKKKGIYDFGMGVLMTTSTAAALYWPLLYKNGVSYRILNEYYGPAAGTEMELTGVGSIFLNVGDSIDFRIHNNSATPRVTYTDSRYQWAYAYLVKEIP